MNIQTSVSQPVAGFFLTDAQRALQDRAARFAETVAGPKAAEIDRTEAYPHDTVAALAREGFMGMTVPSSLGGRGHSYLDTTLVIEEMAKRCGVTGRIVVEGNMGAVGAILAYGSPEQREDAAAHVLSGDKPAICITEPDAGSAATEMTTTAVRDGDSFVLNGTKHWITGGGVSRLHLIFARLIEDGEDKASQASSRISASRAGDRNARARHGSAGNPGDHGPFPRSSAWRGPAAPAA